MNVTCKLIVINRKVISSIHFTSSTHVGIKDMMIPQRIRLNGSPFVFLRR